MSIIEGVDVCDVCGQEVCDCGSGLMHSMEPDDIEAPGEDYSEAFYDGDHVPGGSW